MHAETREKLFAAIRAEVQADPAGLGYAGKTPAEIAALMSTTVVVAPPPEHRDVLVSDVEGYLEGKLAMQSLIDWIEAAQGDSQALATAKTLRRVMSGGRLTYFLTKNDAKRANVLGMFQVLASTEGTGITQEHASDLAAMTVAPEAAPTTAPPRWMAVIDGIEGFDNEPGPPNAADEALIAVALNG